jgi:hypothetical protein
MLRQKETLLILRSSANTNTNTSTNAITTISETSKVDVTFALQNIISVLSKLQACYHSNPVHLVVSGILQLPIFLIFRQSSRN